MIKGILSVSLLVNLLFGFLLLTNKNNSAPTTTLEASQNDYPLISKRVFVDNPNDILINFVPLRHNLQKIADTHKNSVSIYFEYLPSGTSIGINDKSLVRLSSLSKIPTVMAIYKKMEKGELSKNDVIQIQPQHIDAAFGTLANKGSGATVTIEEVIKHSITESDNTAQNILLSLLTPEEINSVYEYLDIPFQQEDNHPLISAKNYSSILRSLYLSSFVSFKSSQEILDLMTKTIFQDKLPAGVPAQIPIAHKIGVFELKEQSQSAFSDCGIVYIPKRPYILCILTKGDNAFAQQAMKEISKTIYEYVVNRQ